MKLKVVIADYGVGNTFSVSNAISFLGYRVTISDREKIIKDADAIILPGVGAFGVAMKNLEARNLHTILNDEVIGKKKPILGICVGMQMMASQSEEDGIHKGLNWINGNVRLIKTSGEWRVPHVGWNNIKIKVDSPMFSRLQESRNFYFDHSYHVECDEGCIAAYCDYGIPITAAVQKENIFGVQFHPEKSQNNGLRIFRSFFNAIDR